MESILLRQELIVDVKNCRATYRGSPLEISPNTPFPFRMLACLREAFPSRVNKETLIEQVWHSEEGSDDSSYYKLRAAVDSALRPHGLALSMPWRLGMSLEVLHESEIPVAQGNRIGEVDYPSKVVVYGTWEPSKEVMSKAEQSITIVDSFYSEYWDLDLCVGRAIQRKQSESRLDSENKKLEISVYMTSPATDFGVQRGKEIERLAEDKETCIELMKKQISDDEREDYRIDFKGFIKGLRLISNARPSELTLKIYEYFAMPSTRLIVVDDRHFFFGWFPLWEHNPRYFCLYLEENSLEGADRELVRRLRGQIENVSSISKLAYSSTRTHGKIK